MKKLYSRIVPMLWGLFSTLFASAQIITVAPALPTDADAVTITFDASKGNKGLMGFTGDVYAHTGVITNLSTSSSDWKYTKTSWGVNTVATKLTRIATDVYQLTISPSVRSFYGVPAGEIIKKLAFVFRSADATKEGKTETAGDIFYDVYNSGLNVVITSPLASSPFTELNSTVSISATGSSTTKLSLYVDNALVKEVSETTLSHQLTASAYGKHRIKVVATDGTSTKTDSTYFYVRKDVTTADLPANTKPGINYMDNNTVTLVLEDPAALKSYAFVIGDFTNWELDDNAYMNRTSDGKYYWITLNNLVSGKEYIYQYFVDGSLRLADPYCEKVSDPWNDKYITSSTYPNLIAYPEGKTSGIASVFQTAQPTYNWAAFTPPASNKLNIYELHIRDFCASRAISTVQDSLHYLQTLGINAIELMPVNEFEGNDSWGYNPDFYFAFDKAYGTKSQLQAFIAKCHEKGIAVILDMVLNHSFGLSPMTQMYWDATNNTVSAQNPWFNPVAKHPYNVGLDFNHESAATKAFCKRVMNFWLTEYHVDGFRFDLSKGFTQTNSGSDVGAWGNKDQSRINIWKDYYDYIKSVNTNAYVILEHFANNDEETELANYGMLLWGNMNYDYGNAACGPQTSADFSWISYKARGWNNPNVVGYMESHDEERLMYKTITNGSYANTSYDIRTIANGLKRQELAANLFFTIPGPKMIWQFGELGYDYSINYNERTGAKPVKWDYFSVAERKHLYNVYESLMILRNTYPVFQTTDFSTSLNGNVRRVNLNSADMNVTVIGNFDVYPASIIPQFQKTGRWYEFYTGDSIDVTSLSTAIRLQNGEYRLYTDKKINKQVLTSVNKPESETDFSVYPNPAAEQLTFPSAMFSGEATATVSIYTLQGQCVEQVKVKGNSNFVWQVPASLTNGFYLYKVKTSTKEMQGKFIISK